MDYDKDAGVLCQAMATVHNFNGDTKNNMTIQSKYRKKICKANKHSRHIFTTNLFLPKPSILTLLHKQKK